MMDDVVLLSEYIVHKPARANLPSAFTVTSTMLIAVKAKLTARKTTKDGIIGNSRLVAHYFLFVHHFLFAYHFLFSPPPILTTSHSHHFPFSPPPLPPLPRQSTQRPLSHIHLPHSPNGAPRLLDLALLLIEKCEAEKKTGQ
jgi:hypothetical protein